MNKKPLPIVLVTDLTPPFFGGMENHAAEFYKRFLTSVAYPLKKTLVMFPAKGTNMEVAKKRQQFLEGTVVEKIKPSSIYNSKIVQKHVQRCLPEGGILFFNSLYWVRIFRDLRKNLPGIRMVMRSGGNDVVQANIRGAAKTLEGRQKYVAESINSGLDMLLVNSRFSFGRSEKLGINPAIMRVVTGGVDTRRFEPVSAWEKEELKRSNGLGGKKVVFCAVRFSPWKSLETTIGAFLEVKRRIGEIALIIAGDGPLKKDVERRVSALGAGSDIHLLGAVEYPEIDRYYKMSDVYFQTPSCALMEVEGGSYYHVETMGRTFCEASACGIISVSTNVGGVGEVIYESKTGFFAGGQDVQSIALALENGLKNSSNSEMIWAARERAVSQYSYEVVFEKYEKLFEEFS